MNQDPVVIVSAKRTPIGAFQGVYKNSPATDLGAAVIKATIESAKINPELIDEVIMGCVLQAGLGQAPGRQAAIKSGLSSSVYCSTINKVCGSGLKSIMLASDQINLGHSEIIIAGGMENMTMGPYLLAKARGGYRYGHDVILDHTLLDGLEDPYHKTSMGSFAENTAEKYKFSRQDQDAFAIESGRRALKATESGWFTDEIAPFTIKDKNKETTIHRDEQLEKLNFEKVPLLKPAFRENGTVTAANSSPVTDGASALLLMKASKAAELGLKPLAKIIGQTSHSREPEWFTLAPIKAIEKLYKKVGWKKEDVDLYEINEAFAVVVMAAMKDLGLDHSKVNIHGGGCALGHPIGSSGSRIVVTLINALRQRGGQKGVAAICIGGGESVAMAIELL
jgi:acetyl-CoA C-acetyltransferase